MLQLGYLGKIQFGIKRQFGKKNNMCIINRNIEQEKFNRENFKNQMRI